MKKSVPGNSHFQVVIGSPAEAKSLELEIDDANEKLFNSLSLETLCKSYGLTTTRPW